MGRFWIALASISLATAIAVVLSSRGGMARSGDITACISSAVPVADEQATLEQLRDQLTW